MEISDKFSILCNELMYRDNWAVVNDYVENWLWVWDRMPPRMKLIVGYKMQPDLDLSDADIAKMLSISIRAVKKQSLKAKRRFISSFRCGELD